MSKANGRPYKGLGAKTSPAEISKKLQEAELKTTDAMIQQKADRLQVVADEIHDILIREDLTAQDMQMVFKVINEDVMLISGHTKLAKLYGRESTPAVDGGGEGSEADGERSIDGGSPEDGGAPESGGQEAGG